MRKWIAMEAERRKNRSTTATPTTKRKPLSDLTNTLIPSSTKPRIPKPYNYNSSSLKSNTKPLVVDSNPFKSDSSIGSSNINNVPNPSIHPLPSTPPPTQPRLRSSSTKLHNRDGSEPLVSYSRKQTTEKTKKSTGEDAAVPYTDPSLQNTRGKEKEFSSALIYTPVEKTKDKGKDVFVPFSSLSSEPLVTYSRKQTTKRTRKSAGEDAAVPFSSLSSVKTRAKGKAITPCYHDLEEDEEMDTTVVHLAQSCPPQRISINNREQLTEAVDSLPTKLHTDPRPTKKKRLHAPHEADVEPLPQEFIEQQKAYFKEVDDFELLEEEVSN